MLSKWSAAPPARSLTRKHTQPSLWLSLPELAQHPELLHWEQRVKNNAEFKQFYELHVKIGVAQFRVYMAARKPCGTE
jgi:hypothetical protein